MRNLHNIKISKIPNHMLTDAFLSNLWAIEKNLIKKYNYRVRCTSIPPPEEDYSSPIQYCETSSDDWTTWIWELDRINVWKSAGSPLPNLNIPYGPFVSKW